MKKFSVKELANLSGVTVRTLHLYDQIGLLRPAIRTEARYRQYGQAELLRLQQILFYKEIGIPIKEIADILDDPDFNLISALENHKSALRSRQKKVAEMLKTIDKTIIKLKEGNVMSDYKELYRGFTPEETDKMRSEAMKSYGQDAVQTAEKSLGKLSAEEISQLKAEQKDILQQLLVLVSEKPESEKVQQEIDRHYKNIRCFWGTDGTTDKQRETYKGLGELYVSDERFTMLDGKPNPELAKFICAAMAHYANTKL